MLGNGESSSPSNTPGFPKALRYQDQVNAQQTLLKSLGIEEIEAVIGFSMGGQQAWYWGVMFGGSGSGIRTKRIVPIASSAATSPHNYTFLEGPIGALEASSDYDDGAYKFKSGSEVELFGAERPKPLKGLRAFGRAYAAWLTSPAWFREERWRDLGAKSLRDWIDPEKPRYAGWDAEDLLILAKQWQDGDVTSVASGNPKDWKQTLRQMQCPVLIMTSSSDQYFRLEVGEMEREALGDNALWRPIDTIWGHVAGGGVNPDDVGFMDACIGEFLDKEKSSVGGATKENNPLQDIAVIEAVPAS
jgi:homoserine acetyltransferase